MFKPISILLFSILLFISCDCNCNSNCDGIACTEQFVTITITITDSDQNPVILDDFTIIIENTIDITSQFDDNYQLYQGEGIYPIFDDGFQQEYQNQEIEIQFQGFLNGEQIITENYIVGADCCHVYPVSGNYEITIE